MYFLLRDDDTCGITEPKELELCYNQIWDYVPINISVTPFRIPGRFKSVPKKFWGVSSPVALDENEELTEFLKANYKKGRFDFALHGYQHTKVKGVPEYIGGDDLIRKTQKGKKYLESLLNCHINTFVPPFNGIARQGLEAIVLNNMNLVATPTFVRPKYRKFQLKNFYYFFKMAYYNHFKKVNYPYVLRLKDHKEIAFCSVTPAQEFGFIKSYFEKIYKLDGVFVLAVHYHAFQRKLKSGESIEYAVNTIIERSMRNENTQYLTYRDLW